MSEKDDTLTQSSDEEERAVPPLPPTAPPLLNHDSSLQDPEEVVQKWLLPPIAPRFQGKKCLVLDLDETLVHSSFKVGLPVMEDAQKCSLDVDFASSRLHHPG